MPALYVRDFPEDLYSKLRSLAARNHRSVSTEVAVLIEEALKQDEIRKRRSETLELEGIARRRRSYVAPAGTVDSLTLLREDRER